MTARARLLAVLGTLLCGALGVVASTQTWLTVTLADASAHPLAVSGTAAVPMLAPLSLAVLALGAALSIVGGVFRQIFGALAIVIAAILGYTTSVVLFVRPVWSYARAVTDATGIAGSEPVSGLVSRTAAEAWPVVTVAVSVLLAAIGVFVVATAHRWPSSGRKYAATASAPARHARLDAVDSWDGLSRGEDPTGDGDPR